MTKRKNEMNLKKKKVGFFPTYYSELRFHFQLFLP